MGNRGYDSYDHNEAARQAGHSLGDGLFGRPGSINERIRLGLLVGIIATLATRALVGGLPLLPTFAVVFVVVLLAVTASDWLTAPYRGWASHGFVAGLATAALFTIFCGLGMTTALHFAWSGTPSEAAAIMGVLLLLLTVPAWLLWLIWGVFRRANIEPVTRRPAWRLALAPLVIGGTILLLAVLSGGFLHRFG